MSPMLTIIERGAEKLKNTSKSPIPVVISGWPMSPGTKTKR